MRHKLLQYTGKYFINFFFLVVVLFATGSSYGQMPTWIKIIVPVDSSSMVVSNAPLTEAELSGLLMPPTDENLIGSEIELSCSPLLIFRLSNFGYFWNSTLIESFYKYDGLLLDMNQPQKQDNSMPRHVVFSTGLTDGSFMKEKSLFYTLTWKDASSGEIMEGTITGNIRHYYANQDIIPQIEVFSKKGVPLKNGIVRFERLGPGDHGELQADFEIENGKVNHYTGLPLSAGHYRVTLEKPEKCARTFRKNLIVFPDDKPNAEKFRYQASCEKKYNIYAYYNAPGFMKVGVVWRNSEIVFPDNDKDIQVFDVMAYQRAGGQGEPTGTDGEPLQLPYSMTLPMIGKQTFYGHPENEYETPRLLYAKTLGEIPEFRLNKKHDALNSCHIASTNGGRIHLELSIDISAGSDGEYPEQFRIYCDNTLAHANLPAFPINFKVINFTKDDIDKFKKFEKVEKSVSNSGAYLKVVFEPIEKDN